MKLGETAKNLAVLVLITLLSTGVARAAPPADLGVISCQSVAVPPIVRAEGIAELVGDIVITCINIPPQRAEFQLVTWLPTSTCR